MAFFIPRNPLTPGHRLKLAIDPAARIVRAAELGAWCDAEHAVRTAHEQAQQIVEGAQAERQAERERGHREGKEEASHELSTHMAEQYVRVAQYYNGIEDQVAGLVMQGVRRIIGGYSDHERVMHAARSALAAVRNQKQITLRLHPGNIDYVKARTAELLADYPGVGLLDLVPDNRLAADCCVLESDIGVVEASTAKQMDALEEAFRKARGNGA